MKMSSKLVANPNAHAVFMISEYVNFPEGHILSSAVASLLNCIAP